MDGGGPGVGSEADAGRLLLLGVLGRTVPTADDTVREAARDLRFAETVIRITERITRGDVAVIPAAVRIDVGVRLGQDLLGAGPEVGPAAEAALGLLGVVVDADVLRPFRTVLGNHPEVVQVGPLVPTEALGLRAGIVHAIRIVPGHERQIPVTRGHPLVEVIGSDPDELELFGGRVGILVVAHSGVLSSIPILYPRTGTCVERLSPFDVRYRLLAAIQPLICSELTTYPACKCTETGAKIATSEW